MKNIVINGRVLLLPTNGIPRYATEIVRYIDNNCPMDYYISIVIPEGTTLPFSLETLHVKHLPNRRAWDYTQAERYAHDNKALYVNLASKGTLYSNSITTVFDIRPLSYDPAPNDWRSLKYYIKFLISFKLASMNSRKIVTISRFCKDEILENCKRKSNEISIIGCGWNHILHTQIDESVFDENPHIIKGNYFLSIGSIAPHKNFSWVIKNANKNPENQYVIVGRADTSLWEDNTNEFRKNVIYLGYQTDERVKALLINAKALVFPSLYEGFGIPPLEALGCKVKAIVSDIQVMREIFGNTVYYIDPHDTSYNLDEVISKDISDTKDLLVEYSWENQGKKWLELIRSLA